MEDRASRPNGVRVDRAEVAGGTCMSSHPGHSAVPEVRRCRERDKRQAWSHDVPGEERAFPGGPGSPVSAAESSRMRSEGPPSDSAGPRPLVTLQGHLSGPGGGEAQWEP